MVLREIEVKEDRREKAVEEVLKTIGVEIKIKEIKRLSGGRMKRGEIIWIKLQNEE